MDIKPKPKVLSFNPNDFSRDAQFVFCEHQRALKIVTAKLAALQASIDILTSNGTTSNRPAGLTAANAGQPYFDTTLGKPVWWNGTAWVDATGTSA